MYITKYIKLFSLAIFSLISIRTISHDIKVYLWKSLRSWVLLGNEKLHKQFPIIREPEELGVNELLCNYSPSFGWLFSYSISLNWSSICFCNCYCAPGRFCTNRSTCKAELPSLTILPANAGWKGECKFPLFTLALCIGWHVDVGRDYILSRNRILLYLIGLSVITNYMQKSGIIKNKFKEFKY